jgi:hypothetical protein
MASPAQGHQIVHPMIASIPIYVMHIQTLGSGTDEADAAISL